MYDPDPQEVELFQTIKIMSEQFEKPDTELYDPDEFYFFPIISVNWLKRLEAHTEGLEPYPEGIVNSDLLDEDRHNDRDKVFIWGSKRKHYSKILKPKLKFKKDYVICPEAAWDMIRESFASVEIWRKFYVEKNSFHQLHVDFDLVFRLSNIVRRYFHRQLQQAAGPREPACHHPRAVQQRRFVPMGHGLSLRFHFQ